MGWTDSLTGDAISLTNYWTDEGKWKKDAYKRLDELGLEDHVKSAGADEAGDAIRTYLKSLCWDAEGIVKS